MKRIDLDILLKEMLESHEGVSDLLFSVGRPPQVEAYGVLKNGCGSHEIENLSAYQVEQVVLAIIGGEKRLLRALFGTGSCDCGYSMGATARFRVNIFRQQGKFGVVMRKVQSEIPTLQTLKLPPIFQDIARVKNGLVLVTGATGSGKTTSLAAILNEINGTQPVHVVTLEDPIEFVHAHKLATFHQRELGADFDSYANGLRAALRQAPKVILVGEMRDRESVEVALTAAETGHLVLSTLHTIDAGQTVNRILGMFEPNEQQQIRLRLADTIRFVVSQRLVTNNRGGRLLLTEVMGTNLRVREAVALGENETRCFYDIIEASQSFGWMTFDYSILRAYEEGSINETVAELYATRKGVVTRGIDDIQKSLGLEASKASGLQLEELNTGKRKRGLFGVSK